MASKTVSTPLSIFALNELFTWNFSTKSIKNLCKRCSIVQKEGHERIAVLLLDILGDANQKMQMIIPKMADRTFQAVFRARCMRHLVYVDGWRDNRSPLQILQEKDVNSWYQNLNFDTTRNPEDRVLEERWQTFRFLSEPQEACGWKGGCESAQQLYQNRITLRKQLYAFAHADSSDLNTETAIRLGGFIYKDIALYAGGFSLTWIEALQDWTRLCRIDKKHVTALIQLLPLKIFWQKKGGFFLPEGVITALKLFLQEHSPLSFQEFIAFSTLCLLEQSLQLPGGTLDRTVWMTKCTASEHLRSRLAFFSCYKIALLPKESAPAFHADESDLLSFHFLACLDVERGLTIKPKETKEDKKISVDSPSSALSELRLSLFEMILARDKKWDKKLFAYLPCPLQIPAEAAQKNQVLAREKIDSLKLHERMPNQYACCFFLMLYKEQERFAEVESWLLCSVQGMTAEGYCEIALREEIAELVPFFTRLAKNLSFPLTKNQVDRDIRLYLEKKENAITYLKYLHFYEECMGEILAPSTSIQLRWEDLPSTLNREPKLETLKSFSVYLSSEYCSSLEELQKVHLWFKWIADEPTPALFASISSTISALTQYLGYAPHTDVYFLLRNLSGSKTQADHLQHLMSLRLEFIETRAHCIIRPRLIQLWETALNTTTVYLENPLLMPPEDQGQLEPCNARIKKNCYKATFLPLQVISDCFYIQGIAENSITYSEAEVFYNHGGQLKEILPSIFVAVNWEPYTGSSPLMLSLFFLNVRTKHGRWLFCPLNILPSITLPVQQCFFSHLRDLAKIFLAEGGAKKGFSKPAPITAQDISRCYPQAKEHVTALDKIGHVEIALKFLTRLKIETRSAWWEALSVYSPEKEEEGLCVEKERKMREPPTLMELSEDVIGRAKTAIQQQEKDKDLAKIKVSGSAEATLLLSSTNNKAIEGNCFVTLSFAFEKQVVLLSALDYTPSFLKDDAAFALLFSKHVLGLKSKCSQEKMV